MSKKTFDKIAAGLTEALEIARAEGSMSIKQAALETVYSVLEDPMAEDHRQIRSGDFMANAATRDIAQKIVAALLKSNLLREETGEFQSVVRLK